jgi:predicted unusual protein kinase regulating ubiquinone biosynthesis (AarF/ABC1/UbiB family)
MPDDPKNRADVPTSRLGRLARLGALGSRAIPLAMEGAKRALGGERTEEEERASRMRTMVEGKKVADAMLKTLGDMKGLPLKIGQMLSYVDGLAPPGQEERFQAVLKKLQSKAPPLDPAAADAVIRRELGAAPEAIFAEWEREPFAAASIGQVHRAVTKGGDRVAVKVQYPGIDKAIESDLKSLAMLEQLGAPIGRKYHTKETTEEIAQVFRDELDYGREAEMTDLFRRMHGDVAGVSVPRVHHSLSTKRVLVTELVEGKSYQEFCATASQDERNAAGVTIWTFMFRALLKHGVLYADPHPGNYRFLGGGDVAFLDFGCVKTMPPDLVQGMKRYMRAALDSDWREFDRACVEVLGYDQTDTESWDLYRSYTIELLMPITSHATFQCSPEVARETVGFLARGIKKIAFKDGESMPQMPGAIHMPKDFTFVNRLQWGLASVLGGLRTEARFRPITEPWIRSDVIPPP